MKIGQLNHNRPQNTRRKMHHMAGCKKVRVENSSFAVSEETDLVLSSFRQVRLAHPHTCKTSSAYVYPLEGSWYMAVNEENQYHSWNGVYLSISDQDIDLDTKDLGLKNITIYTNIPPSVSCEDATPHTGVKSHLPCPCTRISFSPVPQPPTTPPPICQCQTAY
jgi:hypothetical protein